MTFVFWQNMVAIHQMAFLNSLGKQHKTVLVVEELIAKNRKEMGWNVPDTSGVDLYVSPDQYMIYELIDKFSDDIHIFSSISAYKMVYQAFLIAKKMKKRIFIMVEPFDVRGVKGFLRKLKWWYQLKKYKFDITAILATGDLGVNRYKKLGFPADRIFEWGYFTEEYGSLNCNINKKINFLFVGQLIDRKNIVKCVKIALKYKNKFNHFYIVGSGPQENKLKKILSNCENITLEGIMSNHMVRSYMNKCDVLLLPSKHDGWGAVINEALQEGLRVIVSNSSGASSLITNQKLGTVYSNFIFAKISLSDAFLQEIKKGSLSIDDREYIKKRSINTISGLSAARYFESIIYYVLYDEIYNKPISPWKFE